MTGFGDERQDGLPGPSAWQLRAGALIALVALAIFLPLQFYFDLSPGLRYIWPAYVVQVILAAAVLVAAYTPLGGRHTDRLTMFFVGGLVLSVFWAFVELPGQPSLMAFGLTCAFVGSAVFFSWSTLRVLGLCLLTIALFTAMGVARPDAVPPAVFVLSVASLVVGATISVAGAEVLSRFRARLARRERDLASLSARLMSVQEEERRKLSRELHDELGQSLTAVSTYLWLVERHLPAGHDDLRQHLVDARRLASQTLSQMRELSQLLRPSVLDDLGLVPSLDSHLRAFGARHDIVTHLTADDLPARLPPEIETAVFRITQEALTNVARHARASLVRVRLTARVGELRLEVQDDGVGLPPPNGRAIHGIGLIGIRERVRALGGSLRLTTDAGTQLAVRLPL
jgi:signal transduction histidine kinase